MSLLAGIRIGSYEIAAPIGAGGMGEVYRAHDSRLNRDVAIKVLPESFAENADRLERFSREARAVSALNHPNILTIHELGTHQGQPFIVMELLEGSDLRALMNGKPLPLRKVVDHALQLLDGLAAAHDKGIIHRDLKPANIFVTRDGRVKILDFGLARVAETTGADVTRRELTSSGVVMGTAGYMSPEQVRGERADHRSDLFAFGAILYEMLSGRPAFARGTNVETMTAVLNEEPPELSATTAVPPALERIVRRCLEKSPDRRFRSATDLGFAIGTPQSLSDSGSGVAMRRDSGSRSRGLMIALALAVLIAAIAIAMPSWRRVPAAIDRPSLQLSLAAPPGTAFTQIAISPDGRWLAFAAATGPKMQLWVRALDETTPRVLPGTEGAARPFWSPDSRFIGYFAAGKLRKIAPTGEVSSSIADVGVSTGGAWNRDGVILFGSLGGGGLAKVGAGGGPIEQVIAPDPARQETDLSNPVFLPDGRHFLFNIFSASRENRGTFVTSLDGGERHRIVDDPSKVAFAEVPGAGGYLFFVRETALMAQPFDTAQLTLIGEARPLTDMVGTSFEGTGTGVTARSFTVSNTGMVIFDPVPTRLDSHLFWIDRQGKSAQILNSFNHVGMVQLSPDGRRFIVGRVETERGNFDLWIAPASGESVDRATFDPSNDHFPVWSPDGRSVAWSSNRTGVYQLYRKAADGTGSDELLFSSPQFKFPSDWTRDGTHIIFRQIDPKTHYDVWALPTIAGGKPFPLLTTEANEASAVVSPDGRRIAYASDETGRYEVYVQSFPRGGAKRQVSTLGGMAPIWRGDGRELFFQAADGNLMAIPLDPSSGEIAGTATALFSFAPGGILITPYYSVSRDGQRFLVSQLVNHGHDLPLTVLVDWQARLQSR